MEGKYNSLNTLCLKRNKVEIKVFSTSRTSYVTRETSGTIVVTVTIMTR